jgi:hypothetical protein
MVFCVNSRVVCSYLLWRMRQRPIYESATKLSLLHFSSVAFVVHTLVLRQCQGAMHEVPAAKWSGSASDSVGGRPCTLR